jgi:tetratricopeptide (TPR) repeat protein
MTTALRAALALAAALLAAPLGAKEPAPEPLPDLATLDRKEIAALFTADEDRWMQEPCTFGVPVIAALESHIPPPVPSEFRNLRFFAEILCAEKEKRYEEGLTLIADFAVLAPDVPLTAVAIQFALQLDDPDRVIGMLRGLDDAGLGRLEQDTYWSVIRAMRTAGRTGDLDTLALEWVDAGKFAFLDTELHETLAVAALRAAAKAGRGDVADSLLVSITDPVSYTALLTERVYAPYWPQIEARAGRNLAVVGEENVRVTRARLTNAPEDRDRFSAAAYALHYNGQFEDAIALAQRWRERKAKGVGIEEGDAWALNIEAYAYDSLGQTKKADAVFDELARYDPEEHDWVVNFVINRTSRLVGQGRWKEGLKASELARKVAENYGSPYAKLIIARDRACAFERLGRAKDAAPALAFLRENWKEGAALSVMGLMCHGMRDEAAGLLIEGLRDEALRDLTLGALAAPELDLFYTASILLRPSDLLADHPELAAEFAKHVRAMPEEFIPQAALRRAALKKGMAE